MIMYPHAVVNPRAVMIESFHTLVTDGAMSRTRCSQDFTVWTHLTWMYVLKKIDELVVSFKVARISP